MAEHQRQNPEQPPMTLDRAKAELKALSERLQQADTDALVAVLQAQFDAAPKAASRTGHAVAGTTRAFGFLAWLCLLGLLTAAAVALAHWFPPSARMSSAARQIDLRLIFTYLAFVVALASYLASVAREIIKRLGNPDVDDPRSRSNLFFLTVAEAGLVLAGICAAWKLIGSAELFKIIPPARDSFLLWMLAVVLLYLAALHLRIWFLYRPWKSKSGN